MNPTATARPVSYGRPFNYGNRVAQRSYVPRHMAGSSTGMAPMSLAQAPTEIIQTPTEAIGPPMGMESGPLMYDALPGEGELMGETVSGCDSCGGCGSCTSCCLIPCPSLALKNFEFFAGVQGFTGPLNRGETGSFGFHYGANYAAPVPCLPNQPIGMQIGYRGVSSNYSGASFSEDSRNQGFITAGLFRRVDWGLQGGVVVDVLTDDWYYDTLELTQLRGELSWVYPNCHELGFWFTASTKNNDVESILVDGQRFSVIETYEPTDLLSVFYRRRFEEFGGGYGRISAGFTGEGEGLIGTDFNLPLTPSLAVQSGFTYLIPKDGNNRVAHLQEAWNVGISLVWYPGQRATNSCDYSRPLFTVADNGNFIVRPISTD